MLGLFKSNKKVDQIKVLLVDDEADLINTVQCRLKHNNFDVVTASNGKEGLEVAANEHPDIILLDTNMPIMDGHEMLKHLKNNSKLKDIPVIMCTALCEPQDIAIASSYGIADYVAKPFDFTDLMEKISQALENRDLA